MKNDSKLLTNVLSIMPVTGTGSQ